MTCQATPPLRRHSVDRLTDREREILDLVTRPGWTRKAAARELGLNRRTVDRHLTVIYAKLGVDSAGAAGRAFGQAEWQGAGNTHVTEQAVRGSR